MKVLHLLYSGLGGHGNVFFSLVKADVDKTFKQIALFNGVENVREEYIERCKDNNIEWEFIKKKPGLDVKFYRAIVKAIRSKKPDIIFLHGSTAILPAKIASFFAKHKAKIIVRETQANHLKSKADWFWLTIAMVLANKIVFLSNEYKEQIKKKLSLVYRKKAIAVIPNGIDLHKFYRKKKEAHPNIIIGMQSRIVKIKDHKTLLYAFAELCKEDSFKNDKPLLKIAGDGDCKKNLEELVAELNIQEQVVFTGILAEDELVLFLQELDIYVHASFGETMSTAIMQAMACGLPIIASDVSGINNMIQNKVNGLLVPVEDATKLKQALQLFMMDDTYRNQLAENGYEFATEHYGNQRMFAAYKTLFQQ